MTSPKLPQYFIITLWFHLSHASLIKKTEVEFVIQALICRKQLNFEKEAFSIKLIS